MGKNVLKMSRYETHISQLIHFKHKEALIGVNSVISASKRAYKLDKLQYENKIAQEIGQYYIRQISFITYLLKDVIFKGNKVFSIDRSGRYKDRYPLHLRLIRYCG